MTRECSYSVHVYILRGYNLSDQRLVGTGKACLYMYVSCKVAYQQEIKKIRHPVELLSFIRCFGLVRQQINSNGSIAPSDGLELAENYIRWPRPTAEQGQLQASQAKISGFSIWWPAVKLTSSSVHYFSQTLTFRHPFPQHLLYWLTKTVSE